MHFRHSVDPAPLRISTTMDYGNYREVPEYYHPAMDPLHAPPPIHYAPYPHPPMPPIKLEPIVPHDNDSKWKLLGPLLRRHGPA